MSTPAANTVTSTSTLERFGAFDRREVLLGGSAIAVAVAAHADLPLLAIGLVFLVASYLRPARLQDPRWWLAVAIASFVVDGTVFLELDDHTVLAHYWALAIGVSLLAEDPDRSLEVNGRLLIGLTTAFAVASKLAWGEFADGSFFESTLLLDDRFSWPARLAGIADPAANQEAYVHLVAGDPAPLATGPRVRAFAVALTVGTLALESALAVVHLLPFPSLARVRLWLVATFCVATYAIVPVVAFGGILLMMTAADRSRDRRSRLRILAGMLGLYAWGLVWVTVR